jgi:hypothetical protein
MITLIPTYRLELVRELASINAQTGRPDIRFMPDAMAALHRRGEAWAAVVLGRALTIRSEVAADWPELRPHDDFILCAADIIEEELEEELETGAAGT